MNRPFNIASVLAMVLSAACQSQPASPADSATTGPECEARKTQLIELLQKLPEHGLSASVDVPLPTAALGGRLVDAPILEISDQRVAWKSEPITGEDHPEIIGKLREKWAQSFADAGANEADSRLIYLAASKDTDLRTLQMYLMSLPAGVEPKLLFGAPALPEDRALGGRDLAARVFAERDTAKRHELASKGYSEFSQCGALQNAAAGLGGSSAEERWPRLRQAVAKALPDCRCGELDAENLALLLVAEQRAGGVALGSFPVGFLKDDRCAAAMPLRSMQQLLSDVEKFEEEFSGDWHEDALHFEEVLTTERLQNYLCVALPDEVLAFQHKEKRTLYWRVQGGACQAWQFEPLSRGAQFGSWRRGAEPGSESSLAVHYWQGAEQIRLFGPTTAESKPTDEGPWQCSQDLRLIKVDETSLHLEGGGRWFFSEAACKQAPEEEGLVPGCISELAAAP